MMRVLCLLPVSTLPHSSFETDDMASSSTSSSSSSSSSLPSSQPLLLPHTSLGLQLPTPSPFIRCLQVVFHQVMQEALGGSIPIREERVASLEHFARPGPVPRDVEMEGLAPGAMELQGNALLKLHHILVHHEHPVHTLGAEAL